MSQPTNFKISQTSWGHDHDLQHIKWTTYLLFFARAWMATRGHSCRLFKQFALREVGQKYFSHCVVNNWNSLLSSIVETKSTNEFKKLFDNLNNDIMFSIDL